MIMGKEGWIRYRSFLMSNPGRERGVARERRSSQGLPRGEFLEAVSDVSNRQYFTQLYAVGLSVYFYLCVHLLTNLNQCKLSANTV